MWNTTYFSQMYLRPSQKLDSILWSYLEPQGNLSISHRAQTDLICPWCDAVREHRSPPCPTKDKSECIWASRSVILQVQSRTSGSSPGPLDRVHKLKTIFLTILKHYLSFTLSFSPKNTVGFSRNYMTQEDIIYDQWRMNLYLLVF